MNEHPKYSPLGKVAQFTFDLFVIISSILATVVVALIIMTIGYYVLGILL